MANKTNKVSNAAKAMRATVNKAVQATKANAAKAMQASQVRYGLFYLSNGRWTTTPYKGFTFTAYQAARNPIKGRISSLKNLVLKSRVRIRPVAAK